MAEKVLDRSRCRMAAFDLDGTLLREFSLTPTDKVKKALNDLKDSGIPVVVSSGRDLSQISPELLGCFSYAVLTNGSCVAELPQKKLIYSHPIPWMILLRAMKKVRKNGGACFLMQFGCIRGTEEGEKIVFETMLKHVKGDAMLTGYAGEESRYHKDIEAANPFAAPTYKVQAFFGDGESCGMAFAQLEKEKGLEILKMFGTTIEITASGVTKAAALDALCAELGLESGSYAAFGDGRNDLEMLQSAAYAVVMENGEQCVKDIADYIAPPVTEDGAAEAIYDLFF